MNRFLMLLDCGENFKNAKTLKKHRRGGNVSHCVLKAAEDLITKNKWKTCMFCGMQGTAKRDKDGEMKFFEFKLRLQMAAKANRRFESTGDYEQDVRGFSGKGFQRSRLLS